MEKKTLVKQNRKVRNSVSVYANGPCSCTCYLPSNGCGSAVSPYATNYNLVTSRTFGSAAEH